MKKQLSLLITCMCLFGLSGCVSVENGINANYTQNPQDTETKEQTFVGETEEAILTESVTETEAEMETERELVEWIDPEGMTLETRIRVPEGYARIESEEGGLAAFLREYPLKEDGSPVLLYDGREKGNQNVHIAVFKLPIEKENLQQCADSVMRVYAEYFYQTGQYERIAFRFVNGFVAEYVKWREGNRIVVDGNQVSWKMSETYDDSYESFQQYMRIVFAYAGTLSLEQESSEISLDEIQAGDVFLRGGSPGHVVMVVDVCVREDGNKAFLLAQGYMPAQEFQVLKNPLHGEDPWYYEEEVTYPFLTPEYTFFEGSLRRLNY